MGVEYLWSTKVITKELDLSIIPTIPVGTKEPLSTCGASELENVILQTAAEYVNHADMPYQRPLIVASWLTEGGTAHPLHVDDHQSGAYVCIVWLEGAEGAGGDLELWDPRWWNPKLFGGTYADSKHVIKFKPGTLIMMPSTVWHSVTPYFGGPRRRSLNTVISMQSTADLIYNELVLDECSRIAREQGVEFDGSNESMYELLKTIR